MLENQKKETELIEILSWDGDGFQPLVTYGDWLVALMNWEPRFDIGSIGMVERHNETDEVFVLIQGQSVLFVLDDSSIQLIDMQPSLIYNVPAGFWHNVIGTQKTKWLIVENNDTSYENTEFRKIIKSQLDVLISKLPVWLISDEA